MMYDAVIVGGGPAGLATALGARRAGLDVVVLEPKPAPIDKACGEGLMPGGVAALRQLGLRPRGHELRGIRYIGVPAAGEPAAVATTDFTAGTGLGVARTELHAAFADAVRSAGVETVARRVQKLEGGDGYLRVAGFTARYVIGADGLHSAVRHLAGLQERPHRRQPRRYGLRRHYGIRPWTDHVEVYWSERGEAYVTPVGDDCVGVALLGGSGGGWDERLAAFPALRARLGPAPAKPALGAGPLRQNVTDVVAGHVLLVGDAAGYVDALTGEGVSLALRCAHALASCLGDADPARYRREYRRITRRYRWSTAALVWAGARPSLRARIVPTAVRRPALFTAAVEQLAR